MSIVKPYTFVAGTKARANEVNQDFDILYSQVNSNISAISQNALDIAEIETTKANINGSSSQRFAVADAVTNSDAINKQMLFKSMGNVIDYISGLSLVYVSTNVIRVTSGSAYDSTKTVVLKLDGNLDKQNEGQGANTTYYVYIIGNATGSSTDVLISTSGVSPALPSGYVLYRNLGSFLTNANGHIYRIIGLSNSNIFRMETILPDWSKTYSYSAYAGAPDNGWSSVSLANNYGGDPTVSINGRRLLWFEASQYGGINGGVRFIIPVKQGDVLSGAINGTAYFIPFKGGI